MTGVKANGEPAGGSKRLLGAIRERLYDHYY
jgi:hypothetical protein